MKSITLSVRRLTEFLLVRGSIDARAGRGFDRALEGSRIHRKLQKEGGEAYRAEVPLSAEIECGEFCYTLQGRADGILTQENGITIDEIKTTQRPIERLAEDSYPSHWAQACCYGYMLCTQDALPGVTVRLTYVQADSGEIRRFFRDYTAAQLTDFVFDLLRRYESWARLECDGRAVRTAALQALQFPFPAYRDGQRRMAAAVYRTIAAGERLFCCAPTGIGKTMSALFPALKAMGMGMGEKLFYLTAKTIAARSAENALAQLQSQQSAPFLRCLTLTAKDKICMLPERICTPEACPYADGYFDRARDAVYALLTRGGSLDSTALRAAADEFRVCPYELSLDLSLWCDVIVCDYNYLLDPVVHLQRFFESRGDYIFLLDEAHNGVDRCRDMFSAVIRKTDFLALRKALPKSHRALRTAAGAMNQTLRALRDDCAEAGNVQALHAFPDGLRAPLQKFLHAADDWLDVHRGDCPALEQQLLPLYFDVRFFARIAEQFDDTYAVLLTRVGSDLTVKLLCLDPSAQVAAALRKGRAAILFSATLSPLDYYRTVLGGPDGAHTLGLDSPFDPRNLGLYIASTVSTRYADRADSVPAIVRLLHTMIHSRTGHYIAYFPSYAYLDMVWTQFCLSHPDDPAVRQERGMDDAARAAFLQQFCDAPDAPLLGFCVLGGSYAEGIDLTGDRLIGTAIVGVGLPQVGPEPDLLRDYYNAQNGAGFDYAYRFPGMNKVLQAAGRVIRTERDRGVVLLIDDRFASPSYRALFPAHWAHARCTTPERLPQQLADFWRTS